MGAYLSEPVTTKQSLDGSNDRLCFGASAMQGWRISMEDAHSCVLDYDDDLSLFAVYDGHGGSEVATYAADNLPSFLKRMDEYKNGNLKECLINGFLGFDQGLISEEVLAKLRQLAGVNSNESEESDLNSLARDAEIPLDELRHKLKEGGYHVSSADQDDDGESPDKASEKKLVQSNGKETSKTGDHVQEDGSEEDEKGEGEDVNKKNEDSKKTGSKEEAERKKDENGNENRQEDGTELDEVEEDEEEEEKDVNEEQDGHEENNEVEEEGEDEEDSDDEEDDEDDDEDEEGAQTHWGDGDEVGYDSGSTAVVALLRKDRLLVGNVGDSRCVLCRNGVAIDMSTDHKPENDKELTRIKNAGGRVTSEGRVNGGLNLSRAIGDHRYKCKSDLGADEQQITAMPDVIETEITEADKFVMLACDGIWNVLSSQEVVDFVSERLKKQCENEKVSLSKICEELFDKCLACDTSGDGSGCDNMTAIIVLLPGWKDSAQKTKRKLEEETGGEEDDSSSKKARTE